MSLPWAGKSLLAKLATIFAIGFVISLGLCGLNFMVLTGGAADGRDGGSAVLFVFAYLELAGMILCGIGLMMVALVAIAQKIRRRFHESQLSHQDKP